MTTGQHRGSRPLKSAVVAASKLLTQANLAAADRIDAGGRTGLIP